MSDHTGDNHTEAAAALDAARGLANVDDLAHLPVEAQAAWARMARPVLVELLAALDRQAPADPTPPLTARARAVVSAAQAHAVVSAAAAWRGAVRASEELQWSERAAIEMESRQQLLDAVDTYLGEAS